MEGLSETDSSVVVSETEAESELDPGLLESDHFSETPTEVHEDTSQSEDVKTDQEEKSKRTRKTFLTYKKKFSSKPSRAKNETAITEVVNIGDVEVDEDVDVESHAGAEDHSEDPTVLLADLLHDPAASKTRMDHKPLAQEITNNLKLLLDTSWSFDLINDRYLRLMHHNSAINAAIDCSLYWDCDKAAVGIFVHGLIVPDDNKIFFSKAIPIENNIASISDYLCFLANRVLKSNICSGISSHREFWLGSDGNIDSCQETPCYRSSRCFLLVEGTKLLCQDCRMDLQKFHREESREERKLKARDKFRAKDSNLSKEELIEKKMKWKTRCKATENRTKRLQKKLERLQVKLDKVVRDDLLGILNANEDKMTDMQRLFWESQKVALCAKDKRGLRWHPMMIRIALRLRSYSAGAIEFLRDSKIMVLPSDRTLYDYSHFIDPKQGCQKEVISAFLEKMKKEGSEEHKRFANLMFDEMHIRSGLVTKRSTGELIGYTDLSTVDEELEKLTHDLQSRKYKPQLAKKVLVFLAQCLTSKVQDVVAVYATGDLSAVQLYDRAWEVTYNLEEAGIKVLCMTCDGAAVNRKFIRMHSSADKSATEIYCCKNLASGDGRILYFVIDPPHLLKTIRNALANSYSHRNTRKLWRNGENLSWQVIQTVFELTKHDKHVSHKLTKAHVTLSSFSCMTVLFATQALSLSVANAIENMAHLEAMQRFDTEELVKFIRMMNKFFDCMNGKQDAGKDVRNPDLAAYTDSNDPRLIFLSKTFLDYFEDWKHQVQTRPGIFSATERGQMIISYQALESLQITVRSIVSIIKFMLEIANAPAVNTRLLNQDSLEQYFGKIRRHQGDNRNPTLMATLDTSFNLRAQGLVAMASKKGNTSVEEAGVLQVDHNPLPKRQKKH